VPKEGSTPFASHFLRMTDEELMSLALERCDLVPEASDAWHEELQRRSITDQMIVDYREAVNAAPEAEPEPPLERIVTSEEIGEEPIETVASRRPAGITLLAFVCWLNAVWMLFQGAVIFRLTPVGGILLALLGVALFVVGVGLRRLRPWSRVGALIFLGLNVGLAAVSIIVGAIRKLLGQETDTLAALWMFFNFVYSLLLYRYLLTGRARTAFLYSSPAAGDRGPKEV
jgi:hypothetical protein